MQDLFINLFLIIYSGVFTTSIVFHVMYKSLLKEEIKRRKYIVNKKKALEIIDKKFQNLALTLFIIFCPIINLINLVLLSKIEELIETDIESLLNKKEIYIEEEKIDYDSSYFLDALEDINSHQKEEDLKNIHHFKKYTRDEKIALLLEELAQAYEEKEKSENMDLSEQIEIVENSLKTLELRINKDKYNK